MANIDQIRKLNYNGEDIGMGFHSDIGKVAGIALDFTPPTGDVAQEAVTDVSIITSHEELLSRIHMSAQLEGRYSIFSGGAKTDFAKDTQYNSNSTFVLASMVMANTVSRGKDFKLKPDLQRLLDTGQTDVFEEAFGDSFVRGHYSGGEFYAVMRITSVDTKVETDLAVTLHTELTSGPNFVKFQGELDEKNQVEKIQSEFSVHFYQKGGEGKEEIGSTIEVAEIKARLHNFPDAVKNHPFPAFIEVATYDVIPLPVPSKEQKEDFLLALADADSKKLKFMQLTNDCEFAADKPEYFSDPPTKQVLLAMAATYTQLTNAAIAHALALASGKIPPQLFDPSKLTPPLSEPELVLRKRDVGAERSFADRWVLKDDPQTTKNDHDLVTDIAFLAMEELPGFGSIGDARKQGEALSRVISSFRRYTWDHAGQHDSNRAPLRSLAALPTLLPLTVTSLAFEQNALQDTKGLDQFATLVGLGLDHNQINSITELGSLLVLRDLSLVDNGISDIGPLRNCTSLETLDISGNSITDLTPLGSCKRLKNLTLSGTTLFTSDGKQTPSGNPIVNALALGDIPGTANPFTIGSVLSVRFGVLTDGPEAQFTGTATRIASSNVFRVRLTRGGEVTDEVWTLRKVSEVTPDLVKSFALFFPSILPGDVPSTGSIVNINRGSESTIELNFSFVDPANPKKCGADVELFPAFGTKVKLPSFDALVVS